MLKLIIEDDEGRKTVVPFVRDEITIGRLEGNTIRLTERNVSRRHARLLRQNGSVMVEDLGSYNGIRVNGEKIEGRAPLTDGDLVQIGDYDLAIQHEGADQPVNAPTPPPEAHGHRANGLGAHRDEPGVELLGYLPKSDPAAAARLQAAYEAADVFCLPTRFEPFGIVVLEAMFNGLPVVGARSWAMPDMVDEGVTGHVVDRDDVDALADRLLRLLTDPEAARRMGEAGRRRAHERFTWDAVARTMLAQIAGRVRRG